ncbi:MAG: arylsulfatase, partial [Acidobacteriota bacterium]|nr:arylsulfatase [Acidobacteriota bacterium]
MTRRQLLAAAASARALPAQSARPRSSRPNILLLMADQFRADCLGVAGNRAIRTPHLDRLAGEGVRFVNACSSTPTCTPARAGLLTGLSPWNHGMLRYAQVARSYPVEMPRALREAGYYTAVAGKLHYHPQRDVHGYHQALLDESGRVESIDFRSDYRSWFWSEAPNLDPDATGLGWNDYDARPYVLPERLHPTAWIGATATSFIESYQRPEPFFLKVSFERPHSPYDPPRRFWDQFETADLPAAVVAPWAQGFAAPSGAVSDAWHGDFGAAQVRRSRQGYYASVAFVDEQIGRVLDALERRGWLEETLILFFSDHGDMLGDHHLWRKSYPYEGSAKVPFLLRWPRGMFDARRGRTLEQPIEMRDVLPTLLDAAGVTAPRPLDGRSLLPLVSGRDTEWRPWLDLEHGPCYSPENHWNALTDGRYKYIFHAHDAREQLFETARDPGELHDLAG